MSSIILLYLRNKIIPSALNHQQCYAKINMPTCQHSTRFAYPCKIPISQALFVASTKFCGEIDFNFTSSDKTYLQIS
jgi:hypothetical protein